MFPRHGAAALGCLLLLLAAGCARPPALLHAPPPQGAVPTPIDAIVLQPVVLTGATKLPDGARTRFDERLRALLGERAGLRLVDELPPRSERGAIIRPRVEAFDLREAQGEGVFLRAADVRLGVTVQPSGEGTLRVVTLRYAWRRAYAPAEAPGDADADLGLAVDEVAGLLAERLRPGAHPTAPALLPAAGADWAHPALVRGNRFAAAGAYERAVQVWELVLFDPVAPPPPYAALNPFASDTPGYRLSQRGLARLRRQRVAEGDLEALAPLVDAAPLPLADFRERLLQRLDARDGAVEQVLAVADPADDRVHLNLAAAHRNLGEVYRLQHRYDLAGFHLGRAWAHDPQRDHLHAWVALQTARNLLSIEEATGSDTAAAEGEQALQRYLRLPPPATAVLVPGTAEREVLPAAAFPPAAGPAAVR